MKWRHQRFFPGWRTRGALGVAFAAAILAVPASAQPFADGEVFAALPGGEIARFDAGGRKRGSLWAPSGGQMTGMCFDEEKRLYATDFSTGVVVRFGTDGELDEARWADGFGGNPESCVVDAAGHVYVGTVEEARALYKFDASGNLLEVFRPRPAGSRGMDWIDLASNQCTMFYTSEGPTVGRFNVCTGEQMEDLAQLEGTCFALRVRDNGEVMVACGAAVYRLSKDGDVEASYRLASETLFGLNLDRDGRHFWTGGISSANVYRVEIASGQGVETPFFNAASLAPPKQESRPPPDGLLGALLDLGTELKEAFKVFAGGERMGGLAVYGERQAARRTVARPEPPPPPPAAVAEEDFGDEAGRSDLVTPGEVEAPGAALAPSAPPDLPATRFPQPPPPAPPSPAGVVQLGTASPVHFATLRSGSAMESQVVVAGLQVRGRGRVSLRTDLELDRVVLEAFADGAWRALEGEPLHVDVVEGRRPAWPVRVRVGDCPGAPGPGQVFSLFVDADGADGGRLSLRIPLDFELHGDPWLHCWWPFLAVAAGLAALGVGFHGFVSPSRFSPKAALVLSPEEDISEGFSHPLRAERGSRSGFYRDARLFLREDFRLDRRPAGAWVRLRAEGQRLRVKPVGGGLFRQTSDGDWERLADGESTLRPGVPHRNEMSTIFFEYRQR